MDSYMHLEFFSQNVADKARSFAEKICLKLTCLILLIICDTLR